MSALALLPRFAASPSLSSAALLAAAEMAADVAGADSFVHRNYTALFASVPVLAIGSIATFLLKDRLAEVRAAKGAEDAGGAGDAGSVGGAGVGAAGAAQNPLSALSSLLGDGGLSLRPDEELALVGVTLAMMAERLEHDPVAYPLLAGAAARLVPELAHAAGRQGWTGLTERARRAAVDVLRPLALTTLVRAATWEFAAGEQT
ncbi:MAG: hypothetical protein ACRDVE_21870 [Actinocrinis sp.]